MSESERYRIILSKRVASDLKSIFRYVAKDSPANAPARVSQLLDGLRIHRTCSGLAKSLVICVGNLHTCSAASSVK